jgi:hypothetical protein
MAAGEGKERKGQLNGFTYTIPWNNESFFHSATTKKAKKHVFIS